MLNIKDILLTGRSEITADLNICRTTARVEALRLTKAEKLIELTLSRNKSELRAGQVH